MRYAILAVLAVLLIAQGAFAQSAGVTVTQIKAAGRGGEVVVDPKLSDLKARLSGLGYSTYSYLSSTSSRISSGETATWTLAGGRYLDVTFEGAEGEGAQARFIAKAVTYTKTGSRTEIISSIGFKIAKNTPWLQVVASGTSEYTLILAIKMQ